MLHNHTIHGSGGRIYFVTARKLKTIAENTELTATAGNALRGEAGQQCSIRGRGFRARSSVARSRCVPSWVYIRFLVDVLK